MADTKETLETIVDGVCYGASGSAADCSFFPSETSVPIIYLGSVFGIMWGVYCIHRIRSIDFKDTSTIRGAKKEESSGIQDGGDEYTPEFVVEKMTFCNDTITEGAITFLKKEYTYIGLWCLFFGALLWLTVDQASDKNGS